MHQLMRKSLQDFQDEDLKKEVHNFMLGFYSNQLKDLDIKAITSEHEAAITEAFYHAKESLDAEELCDWFISVSNPFYRAALWQLITPLYEEILQILEVNVNPENLLFGVTLNYLGILYTNMGEYEKALPLYQRALEISENVLGPQHSNVATTLNDLALLHYQMGDYEKALPLYKRALDIREKVFGPQHPDVAATLNNLAGLYYHAARYEEALPLLERSLKILERKLSSSHPNFKTTEQNIQALKAKMEEK